MKALIFDSGTLINLSMNGLLYLVEKLKENFDGKFLITPDVKHEIYDHPIKIPRFELGALRIESLIQNKTLESPEAVGIDQNELDKGTKKLMDLINHSLKTDGKWLKIVSDAEISCLALSKLLKEKGIESLIAIDERTTRIISERPENLEKLMERKIHKKIQPVKQNFKAFKDFKMIRSSELVYVAQKKGLTKLKNEKALEALLFATKYKGASISFEEINKLKKL